MPNHIRPLAHDNAKTDWNELLADYNAVKTTTYKTPREMLKAVYLAKGSYERTGKVFLLSPPTIAKYMKEWGIENLPAGHRGSPSLIAILAIGDVSDLTAREIAEKIGFSRSRVVALMAREKIKFKRKRRMSKNDL